MRRPRGEGGLNGPRPLVWVTRAEPGAGRTAAGLFNLGFEPLVAPLIATRTLPGPPPDLAGVGALALTSRAGVAAFLARAGAPPPLPVFAVGDATAEAARAAGFTDVHSAAGAGRDLLALILRDAPPGAVLHAGAREPAFDLVAALAAAGRDARALPLYETAPLPMPQTVAAALQQGRIAALTIHSPAAARALARLADDDRDGVGRALGVVVLAALSAACAAPLLAIRFAAAAVAPTPDESSLLQALLGAGLDRR